MRTFSLSAVFRRCTAVLAALGLSACSPPGNDDGSNVANKKPLVVTTTTMVTDLVRSIAGDAVTVQALMGPMVDPHLFKPGQEDIQHLQKADVIFYSGLHLEGKMADLLEQLHSRGRKVYAVADGLSGSDIIQADGQPDPHIWGDAALWSKGLTHCAQKLSEALPDQASAIGGRAAAAALVLTESHARLKAMAESLPVQKRTLVTSHDAFRYFGRAYGFDVIGIQGISTVTEASLADMARISDIIKQRGIRAVFVESSVSHATIERISKDTGAKIGGELFSDALGAPGDMLTIDGRNVDRGTVAGMLEANMHTIVQALK
jgi:manganese/zinc/iron transport system substrate-binding protein